MESVAEAEEELKPWPLTWSKSWDLFYAILYFTEGFCEERVHLTGTKV